MHRQSYKPIQCGGRPAAIEPTTTVCFGPTTKLTCEEFDCLTVHRASFPVWPDAQRSRLAVPDDHELVGGGGREPMQAVTSQRHDYVSKNVTAADRYRRAAPPDTIMPAQGDRCPMATATTTATTFGATRTPTDGRRPSARPATADRWAPGDHVRMAVETETKCSYRPWAQFSLVRRRCAAPFCRPAVAVNDCTVYTGSYRPPGVFRDPLPGEHPPATRYRLCPDATDDDDDDATVAAGRGPLYPRAHDYNL